MDGFLMASQSRSFQRSDSLCTALVPQIVLGFPQRRLLTSDVESLGLGLQFCFLSRAKDSKGESTEGTVRQEKYVQGVICGGLCGCRVGKKDFEAEMVRRLADEGFVGSESYLASLRDFDGQLKMMMERRSVSRFRSGTA
jgi:hypothetical protein